MSAGLLHAIIPAAGESRRMGRPKLLLPLAGRTVLGRLLDALPPSIVSTRVVVVRPGDEPLTREAEACGAVVVRPPEPPPDMRCSVEWGLRYLRDRFHPTADDAWLLIPADHPLLEASVVEAVAERWRNGGGSIIIPTHHGRRGHPTLFSWPMAEEVFALPPDAGLNQLVRSHAGSVIEQPVDTSTLVTDLDTPEDYAAAIRKLAGGASPQDSTFGSTPDKTPPR